MNVVVERYDRRISELISAHCGNDPKSLYMLDYCQSLGEVYVGYIDAEFICCWGLISPSFLSNQAYLWLWAREPLKHRLVFVRRSQVQVKQMLEHYEQIIGECVETAQSSQHWLRWLGAEFGEPRNGLIPFTIRQAHG